LTVHRRSSFNNRQGLWVAVFGPDGAGKSAAIQRLTQELSPCFRGIERYHFRPMFRRGWQDSSPVTNPHGKPPRGFLPSMLKLLYWLADYWYGYVAIIRPALFSSTLVLFDRYYHDVLVDPQRYRLPVSTLWFAKFLARLVAPPDLYILLDVPADVLQQRKPEVSCDESHRQRLAYLQMFQSMPNAFIVDAACPLDELTQQLKSVILDALVSRNMDRNGISLITRGHLMNRF
jgi:thymidylate kinase